MHASQLNLFGHLVMALLAALTFGAIAATAAQAATEGPFWTVGGVKLETDETREITIKAEGSISLESEVIGKPGSVTCPTAEVAKGSYLAGGVPGTSREVVKFGGGCTVVGNGTGCKVKEPIETKPVINELVVNEPGFDSKISVEFKPATGTEFVTLKFEAGCTLSENTIGGEVLGSAYTDPEASPGDPEVPVETGTPRELTSYLIKFPDPAKSILLWNGSVFKLVEPKGLTGFLGGASKLTGNILVGLVNGQKYGALAGAAATEGPFWTVGGVKLETDETREITIKAEGSISLESEVIGKPGSVTCPTAEVAKGSYLAGGVPGTSREVVKFGGGCTVVGNGTGCKVKEPIETKPVINELVVNEPGFDSKISVEFKPATGTEFVTLKFEAGCTLSENTIGGEVLGSAYTDPEASPGDPEVPVETGTPRELTSYLIKFPDPAKSILLWNGSVFKLVEPKGLTGFLGGASKLTGNILVGLVNGQKYSSG
jgi:hypothetical protein